MRSTATLNSGGRWLWCWLWLLTPQLAVAHPKGFHKKLTVTVTQQQLTALLVMDIDSGQRCLLMREAADSNRDGRLAGDEVQTLKARLVQLAVRPLRAAISGATLPWVVKESKLSLREDRRASDGPLSVAVVLEAQLGSGLREGMELEIADTSPDQSPVVLQVFQANAEPPFELELPSGTAAQVRLGRFFSADAG